MDEEIQRGPFQYSLRASSPPPPGYPAGAEPDCFATDPKQSPGDWEERRRAFLDWVGRETGWQLRYADEAIERSVATIRLHGTIEGLRPDESLDVILQGSGLDHRLEDGQILVIRP